ncbi:MAG TPA: MFS transporter [Ferruginibacter sp.]|nr:MFS transporter [Ferruginibacter sp.]
MISATVTLYRNAYTGLSRRMWLLAVVMLINRSGTMVLPFMTLYCKHIGYTTRQAGYVVAMYGLGSVVGAFLGGKISDRFGFYYTQFFSLFFGGILFITLGQMNSFTSICVCTFFLSMVNESFRPANATAVAHYSGPQNRTQSFSLVRLAINVGWGVGAALGGFLASINYHLLFWVDGFTNITAAFLLVWLLPKVSLAQQQNLFRANTAKTKMAPALADKTFMRFIGLQVLFALCFFQLFTTIPLYFKEGLHINEFWIGVVMAMNGILIAILEMVIVFKLEGKLPYLRLMMLGTILMAVSFFLLNIPLANGFIIAVMAMLIVTFAEMIAMPFMNSYYISRSSEGNRGEYAAWYTMAWSTAQVIGSAAGTQVAYATGFHNLWWIIGGICILTAIGYQKLEMKR